MQYKPKKVAFQLGEVLGVKTNDTKELVDKLKTFSVKDLMIAAEEVSRTLVCYILNKKIQLLNISFMPNIISSHYLKIVIQ